MTEDNNLDVPEIPTPEEVMKADLIIVPVGDRVVIKPIKNSRELPSGLVIPETAEETPQMGVVVAAGTGHLKESGVYNLEVEDGEIVLYSKYAGMEIEYQGETFLVMREDDIFCRLLDRQYVNQLVQEMHEAVEQELADDGKRIRINTEDIKH